MPKGSKKRKAVKKKAHHHPNHNSNHHDDASHSSHNNTYGDDDLKHHEDKESDSESVSSPTSQGNPNSQLDLTDGEKEERKNVDDRSHTPSSEDGQSVDESKVHPEVVPIADEEGGAHIDQELKLADQSNGKTENVEIESTNSDFFQGPDEGHADSDVTGADELKGDYSAATVVEPIKESGHVLLEKSSSDDEALVVEKPSVYVEDPPLIIPDEPVNSLSEGAPPATDGEKSSAVEENGSVTEGDKVALPDEKTNGDDIASATSVVIPDVTVPGVVENKEKEAILLDSNYLATDPVNFVSENKGDKVASKTDVSHSDPNLSASPIITEENVVLPKNAPRTGNHADSMDRSAEQKNDIEVSESSIRQPLLAAHPQPRASWMSCCGLFEVFGGSSR